MNSDNLTPAKPGFACRQPEISVLIPIYNEEAQLPYTLEALLPILEANTSSYEVIFIDDGSKDQSWAKIADARNRDEHIVGIRFSRNFGKEAAICAGLDYARGQAVIIMDADLQHPPEVIPEFLAKWRNGYKIVAGQKINRGKESFVHKTLVHNFYRIFAKFTQVDIENSSDFKLLDRAVVEAWQELKERTTFFRGLVNWLGFSHTTVEFAVQPRLHGNSKWEFKDLCRLALNALITFSAKPLYLVTWLGCIFLLAAFILMIDTLRNYIIGTALGGFTTVILLQLIIGGVIITSLGIIGIYLSKIYDEIKGRPRYLVAESTLERLK